MSILQAIILGIVQGLGEFLPVSSSAHLILVPWAFGWHFLIDDPGLNKTFDVALESFVENQLGKPYLIAILMNASGLVLWVAIWLLLRYVRTHGFGMFAIYRFVVGGTVLLAILLGLRHATGI